VIVLVMLVIKGTLIGQKSSSSHCDTLTAIRMKLPGNNTRQDECGYYFGHQTPLWVKVVHFAFLFHSVHLIKAAERGAA